MTEPEKKLSAVEGYKLASNHLKGNIEAELADNSSEEVSDETYELLKFHGSYFGYDRDSATPRKKAGLDKEYEFMVRMKCPGGRLTAAQYIALDLLTEKYANGALRITTRETFQFHCVHKVGMKPLIADINHLLLSTLGGCGDIVRNITMCPAPIKDKIHAKLEADGYTLAAQLAPKTNSYYEIWLDGEKVHDYKFNPVPSPVGGGLGWGHSGSEDNNSPPPSLPPIGGGTDWWKQITAWRAKKSFSYKQAADGAIKPQYALDRLNEIAKKYSPYVTTDVGQHQMWAAQFIDFEKPNHWMTSGGLGTMGYGVPSAMGVQIAHPESLVVCVTGDASILMNIQELSTIMQYRLPVKIFLLNNGYMGMVRQWQEMFHGNRYSESYMESLPDFVKLAEAYGMKGVRCEKACDVDATIEKMIAFKGAVLVDMVVEKAGNLYPMIPAGAAHYELLLSPEQDASKLNKNLV